MKKSPLEKNAHALHRGGLSVLTLNYRRADGKIGQYIFAKGETVSVQLIVDSYLLGQQ
jgi:hypothetical protein